MIVLGLPIHFDPRAHAVESCHVDYYVEEWGGEAEDVGGCHPNVCARGRGHVETRLELPSARDTVLAPGVRVVELYHGCRRRDALCFFVDEAVVLKGNELSGRGSN